jgi:hypothetical protein
MQVGTEIFLQITEWILVHPVDLIDFEEFFYTETPALRAAALSAEKEEKPLVPDEAITAFPAFQDRIIDNFFSEFAVNAHQITTAMLAIPHAYLIKRISYRQLASMKLE